MHTMIKLIDILKELGTRPKERMAQGFEHVVYPSLNPDRVIKVGETKYVEDWVKDFKSRPDLFPVIYKVGKVKGFDKLTYVELEKLDTEQFEVDYDVLSDLLKDKHYDVLEAIEKSEHNEHTWNDLYEYVKERDEEIADFFVHLYNNVIETKPFKKGWFKVYDFHKGQFGYDKDHKIKMLDY